MFKRMILAILAGLLAVLSACSTPETAVTTDTATQAAESIPPETLPPPEIQPSYTASPLEVLSPVSFDGMEMLTVSWSSGNRVLLCESDGAAVYLCKASNNGNICYDIQLENRTPVRLETVVHEFYYNGNLRTTNGANFYTEPGQWGSTTNPMELPLAAIVGEMEPITRLDILLSVADNITKTVSFEQAVRVNLSGEAILRPFHPDADRVGLSAPMLEYYFSGQQLLTEQNGVRVTVLQVGKPGTGDKLTCLCRIANTSNEWRYYRASDLAINGLQCTALSGRTNLRPGAVIYDRIEIDDFYGIDKIADLQLRVTTGIGRYADQGAATTEWCTVIPDAAAQTPTPLATGQLLLQEQELEVYLFDTDYTYSGDPVWYLAVVNKSGKDWGVKLWDTAVGTQQGTGSAYMGVMLNNDAVYAGKTVIMSVQPFNQVQPVSFRLQIRDYGSGEVLFVTENTISLALPEKAN